MLVGTHYRTRQDHSMLPCASCMELTRQRATLVDADGDPTGSEKPLCEECAQ